MSHRKVSATLAVVTGEKRTAEEQTIDVPQQKRLREKVFQETGRLIESTSCLSFRTDIHCVLMFDCFRDIVQKSDINIVFC